MTSTRAMRPAWLLLALFLAGTPAVLAQDRSEARVTIRVVAGGVPVSGALVRIDTLQQATNADGLALFRLRAGAYRAHIARIGFQPGAMDLIAVAGADTTVEVALRPAVAEIEELIVSSTRSFRRVQDQPIRVDVLSTEEVEEKLLMTPGDITMLLNETPGIRVQTTSASMGGAAVRIQGLRGRYTLVLSDGLPLYGSQVGGLGPLQIPPMDLGQVEIIKGAAAALYGPAALGGVVNLISRDQPPGTDLLVNATSLGGLDASAFTRTDLGGSWRSSLLLTTNRQARHDRNGDGWTDVAGFERLTIRPRVRWDDSEGRSLLLMGGTTVERRRGGTLPGAVAPDGDAFAERLDSERADLGLVARWPLTPAWEVSARASGAIQWHRHRFDVAQETDRHETGFSEATLLYRRGGANLLAGGAVTVDRYRSRTIPGMNYGFTVPALFAQLEVDPAPALALSVSARIDDHSRYGTFLSPRGSLLLRPGPAWNIRVSAGTGFFAPTPFVDQTEQTGLSRLRPWSNALRAEEAVGGSVDVGAVFGGLELNLSAFGSSIRHAVQVRAFPGAPARIELINAADKTTARGIDVLAKRRSGPFTVTSSYTFTSTVEPDPEGPGSRPVPLTPRHAASLVASWEQEDVGRVGVELYYTGRQGLDHDPYRATSRPFAVVGLLVERVFGRVRVFVNGENLTNRRQSLISPLLRPAPDASGRWTTDAWGSLEGRVVNAGLRLSLGGPRT